MLAILVYKENILCESRLNIIGCPSHLNEDVENKVQGRDVLEK